MHFPRATQTLLIALGLIAGLSAPARAQNATLDSPPPASGKTKAPAKKKKAAKKKLRKDEGDWIEGDAGPAASGKSGKKPRGVRAQFEQGQKLYDSGRYDQALGAYDALLRKYPDNEPARVMLAKTLYRLDRIKDSYAVFAKIDPQHLDPETSYEYGWAFYIVKQYPGALYGFQRVPKGHALFDLANYYGAICAIKLRKYDGAQDMLEKAVVLPDKLARSRSLYIKHVQALLLLKEKGALAKERATELDALNRQIAKEKGMREGAAQGAKPDKPAGYVHQGLQLIDRFALVSYAAEHQYKDNHRLRESNYDARIGSFEVSTGPILPIPGWKVGKDRQAAVGLALDLYAEDRVEHGKESRVLVDETNQDLSRVAAKDLGVTDTKSGDVSAEPWIEAPLPENLWLAVGGKIAFHYPAFDRGSRTGSRTGYGVLGGKGPTWRYWVKGAYSEILDPKTLPSTIVIRSIADAGLDLPSKLTADIKVTHETNNYIDKKANLDGPDAVTRGELIVQQVFPFGITAVGEASYELDENYLYHKIPTFDQVAADGQVATGKVTLVISPPVLPWLVVSASQLFQKTRWKLADEAMRDPFELNVVDYLEKFVGSVGVNLAF